MKGELVLKVKIEKVNEGTYGYDSIVITKDKEITEIVFEKKDNVKKYEGKLVDLVDEDGRYVIKEMKPSDVTKK